MKNVGWVGGLAAQFDMIDWFRKVENYEQAI
jgi:hypothetical protein